MFLQMLPKLISRLKWIAAVGAWTLFFGMVVAGYLALAGDAPPGSASKAPEGELRLPLIRAGYQIAQGGSQTAVTGGAANGHRIAGNGPQCMLRLNGLDIDWIPVPDHYSQNGCGLTNGVFVKAWGPVRLRHPVPMTCRMAELTERWLRTEVRPAARNLLGADVAMLNHMAIYDCRKIAGRSDGRLSEHAKSNALDVGGFVLDGGRPIRVKENWKSGGPETKFLRRIGKRACRIFQVVLTPDTNQAHHDHFHLDAGRWRLCVR